MKNKEYNGAGIYKITIGGRVHIGSSIRVRTRIKSHENAARNGREQNGIQELYDAGHKMKVDIVERVDDNKTVYDLMQKEQRWINRYKEPLNVMKPGDINPERGMNFTIDSVIKRLQLAKQSGNLKYKIKMMNSAIESLKDSIGVNGVYIKTIGEVRKNGYRQKEAGNK